MSSIVIISHSSLGEQAYCLRARRLNTDQKHRKQPGDL